MQSWVSTGMLTFTGIIAWIRLLIMVWKVLHVAFW